jgi:hypothetical protein
LKSDSLDAEHEKLLVTARAGQGLADQCVGMVLRLANTSVDNLWKTQNCCQFAARKLKN